MGVPRLKRRNAHPKPLRPLPNIVDGVEVRKVQPYQATKTYRCPGCHGEIQPGTGHVVVIPLAHPEDRRHWHTPCHANRANRR